MSHITGCGEHKNRMTRGMSYQAHPRYWKRDRYTTHTHTHTHTHTRLPLSLRDIRLHQSDTVMALMADMAQMTNEPGQQTYPDITIDTVVALQHQSDTHLLITIGNIRICLPSEP